jgi:hypothetical protein
MGIFKKKISTQWHTTRASMSRYRPAIRETGGGERRIGKELTVGGKNRRRQKDTFNPQRIGSSG